MRISLSGIPLSDLEKLLDPLPPYRARQIFKWIHGGISSFSEMSNLPLALREELNSAYTLRKTTVLQKLEDKDGTIKLQLTLEDELAVESVILSDGTNRKTACISTQAGCPMKCVFCKTGRLGFTRNLDSSEIVEQFLHIRAISGEIANIVFMGMGEPLLNLTEVERAIAVLCESMSGRRITISTCGIISGIQALADQAKNIRLAVSLTTADEDLRRRLMPVSVQNPLPALKEAINTYQKRHGQRVTLEAVLLGGVNTRPTDITAMAVFAQGLDVVVNLIPWNRIENLMFEGKPLQEPNHNEIQRFIDGLNQQGLKTVLRHKKGRSIGGACGQLGVLAEHSKGVVSRET
ncbi:MAG: 23S rRNA (adenine(2503)-C(2))-methyltransferase RlmN [Termitinemataceae bacterium]|nr:MAG: 23S rRNA (adenine(2503)-C(2))-methyltransferase RlmN [Termitinemataceae bacterium]